MLHPSLNDTMFNLLNKPLISGDVGLELEIEGDDLPLQVTGWSVKPEGSLRGRNGRLIQSGESEIDTPREYVSRQPVLIEHLPGELDRLCNRLSKGSTTVRLTPRASTHIHLNMLQETFATFLSFQMIYAMAEPILLRICGPVRNGNLFCIPTYESSDLPIYIQRVYHTIAAYYPRQGYILNGWPKRGKYASLNLDPIITQGSVECRCFPNSISAKEIFEWATYLVNMRSLARHTRITDNLTLLNRAYSDPLWFVSQIYHLDNIFSACAPDHPAALVHYGIEAAYEIANTFKLFTEYDETKHIKKRGKKPINVFDIPAEVTEQELTETVLEWSEDL